MLSTETILQSIEHLEEYPLGVLRRFLPDDQLNETLKELNSCQTMGERARIIKKKKLPDDVWNAYRGLRHIQKIRKSAQAFESESVNTLLGEKINSLYIGMALGSTLDKEEVEHLKKELDKFRTGNRTPRPKHKTREGDPLGTILKRKANQIYSRTGNLPTFLDILFYLEKCEGDGIIERVDIHAERVYFYDSDGAQRSVSYNTIRARLAGIRKILKPKLR